MKNLRLDWLLAFVVLLGGVIYFIIHLATEHEPKVEEEVQSQVFSENTGSGVREFYQDSTVKKEVVTREDGRQKVRWFHQNGELMAEGMLVEQQKDSIWTYYGVAVQTGNLDKTLKRPDRDSSLAREYYQSGQLIKADAQLYRKDRHYLFYDRKCVVENNDTLLTEMTYYENGNLSTESFHKNGKATGTWVVYKENGAQQTITYYEDPEYAKITEFLDLKGRLAYVKYWNEDDKMVRRRRFEEGVEVEDTTYD